MNILHYENIINSMLNSLPLVTVGIRGPTVLKLLLLIALHPDNGGEGCGGLVTFPPASVNVLYFLNRYDPSTSTIAVFSRCA